jgi:predicted ferric reductase
MTTWILIRAAGVGAFVVLFLVVAWGLAGTTGILRPVASKQSTVLLHGFLATVGLALLAIHLAGVLIDSFVPFDPVQVVVPFTSTYRPVAIAFGVVALYTVVLITVSSWLRRRITPALWRRIHGLAIPAFVLTLLHGVFAGTDATKPWLFWTYVASGLVVVFLLLVRGLTAKPMVRGSATRRPPSPEAAQSSKSSAPRSSLDASAEPSEVVGP